MLKHLGRDVADYDALGRLLVLAEGPWQLLLLVALAITPVEDIVGGLTRQKQLGLRPLLAPDFH